MQATISKYNKDRDSIDVANLLEKNELKFSEITPEYLEPYFSCKVEAFNQVDPNGSAVSGSTSYFTYVLRDSEKLLGVISYLVDSMKEPNQLITGNIVLFCVDSLYQAKGEEELLKFALQDMSQKKASVVHIAIHEKNSAQCSMVKQNGFMDITPQIKPTQQGMAKSSEEQQEEIKKTFENKCFYVKILEENAPDEMKNQAPIESSLLNITKANYEQEVLNETKPVVIDVYSDWCGPCRKFAPIFEKASEANVGYKFVRFNFVQDEQELAKELGVEVLPTTIFIKDKKIVGRETGFMSQEILQEKLVKYLG